MLMIFNGADIKVEITNFCAVINTLVDQDIYNLTIHMYSGITSSRVLDGELLYTKDSRS